MPISDQPQEKIVQGDIDKKALRKKQQAEWYQKNKPRINESNRQYLKDYRIRKREEAKIAKQARLAFVNARIAEIEKSFAEESPFVIEYGVKRRKVVFGGHTY